VRDATASERAPANPALPSQGHSHRRILLGLLVAVGGGTILLSPLIGAYPIPAETVLRILLHGLTGGMWIASPCAGSATSAEQCQAFEAIIWQDRLPEIVLAVIAGGALGISGATLQGVFRNPLADPYLLGLSTGGALGASMVFVFNVGEREANLVLPLFVFLGALGTGLAILAAARGRYSSIETLLLTGVALNSFLSAILTLLLLYNPTGSLQVDFWLLGGLTASWTTDGIAFGVVLMGGTLLVLFGRELNLMQLGNEVAQSMGVDARKVRVQLLALTSVVTAVAVAFTGIIGFVGLVSPHIVRRVAGRDYRVVLPGAVVVGATFLVVARDLSYVVLPSSVLPIGIFTAFAGAPFFLYLLYRRRRAATMENP
jgi:iron complex transport system permease protein